MVVANHPLASVAGVRVLAEGGSAVDAAIATAAALGAAEPYLSGLGGDGFMLVYDAAEGTVHALEFAGVAPAAATPEAFADGFLPFDGPTSVVVPGAAAGWAEAHERYGVLGLDRVLAPAIEIAEHGFAASAYAADAMSWAAAQFFDWDEAGVQAWWGGDYVPPGVGDTIRNPRLAATYRALARDGLRSFYQGPIADEIVAFVGRHGGLLTADDLAAYEARWQTPLEIDYRGWRVLTPSDHTTGGLATLQVLQIVEGFAADRWGADDPERLHVLIEAVKLAAEERARYGGDPVHAGAPVPYERLLSDAHADELRTRIDLGAAAAGRPAGVEQPGTSHLVVVDRHGNVVSMTVSIGSGWGSGLVAGETGVVLNNELNLFALDPASPNALAPGKRVSWNMSPTLVMDDEGPVYALGTPGGTSIWQTLPQVLTLLLDQGSDLQAAVDAPRFRWALSGTSVSVEPRWPEATVAALEALGHPVRAYAVPFSIEVGAVAAVRLDRAEGRIVGAADPRREGLAVGW
jgi:gamma-glutamyltranspeptidase/glutathione hydrolase